MRNIFQLHPWRLVVRSPNMVSSIKLHWIISHFYQNEGDWWYLNFSTVDVLLHGCKRYNILVDMSIDFQNLVMAMSGASHAILAGRCVAVDTIPVLLIPPNWMNWTRIKESSLQKSFKPLWLFIFVLRNLFNLKCPSMPRVRQIFALIFRIQF